MANQQKDENEQPVTLTMGALKEMLTTLVVEMKKPHVDPDIVARNEATKARMRAQRAQSERDLEAEQLNCSHLREDNTSRIAWHEPFQVSKQLYVKEGFCQGCNRHFHPGMKDRNEYIHWLKVPTGKVGLIY
jgi:hypothetical protein